MLQVAPSSDVFWRDDVKLWWPIADREPQTAYIFVSKRLADSDLAVNLCSKRRVCVQAGGYVGLWPMRLSKSFERVYTFEVMPGCYEACKRNCSNLPNVSVSDFGLGSQHGIGAPLMPKGTAGSWRIDPQGSMIANLTTIDTLDLKHCDAIILDIEGYEIEALNGARETIERCNPVIQVEELPRSKAYIQAHLRSIGYRERARIHADAIYTRR